MTGFCLQCRLGLVSTPVLYHYHDVSLYVVLDFGYHHVVI